MKRVSKKSDSIDLQVDVLEYAFTEWLVRRGIFSAFKSNYEHAFSPYKSFRSRLRGQIRRSLCGSGYGPKHLITSSFLFASSPEGVKFWGEQSVAWERFCAKFQVKL